MSGVVLMDSRGGIHRLPTANSHRTVAIGTHLQTSLHALTAGLGDPIAVFTDLVWIKDASLVPEDLP